MTFARLMKAIEKAGLKATQPRESNQDFFHVEGPGKYYGEFYKQGDKAICVSTCRKGDAADSMTDYFPQSFCDSIKQFIAWVQE